MKRRAVRYILALAVLLCALCFSAPAASAATAEELLQWMPLEACDYRYSAGNGSVDASVFYSHALLFQDSNTLSPELAKASVVLSVTAYDPEEVSRLLTDMDFVPADNSSDYAWCDESLTFLDCDYAAFTIATKNLIHPITNEEHILYCVPIRGTPPNLEWFIDFNVGAGEAHLGFQRASQDIYERLLRCFQTDGIADPSHRILWLTGHSRGAACANLLAGWFMPTVSYTISPLPVCGSSRFTVLPDVRIWLISDLPISSSRARPSRSLIMATASGTLPMWTTSWKV